ncbi:hypothetical protein [Neobacillus vireti]|uniref:hypothetical protein n=1 Tax=Neobacillus vireti TaxID=220686 RepID=UPI002FFDA4B9
MSNQNKNQNNKGIAEGIKETAGAAFHTLHSALETTENVAMNAVDATKNAADYLTDNGNNRDRSND